MHKKLLAAAIASTLSLAGPVLADATSDRLAAMEQRLSYLEQRIRSQDQVIAEKNRQISELRQATGSDGGWFQSVEIGGLVEIEAGHTSADGAADESDISVPTVEIGIAAQVNDWVAAEVVALYEDEGDSSGELNIDTATVTIADPDSSWFVKGGQYALPFGVFETNMISDPLTLELAETADAALEVGMDSDAFGASVYVFQGDQSDEIENFGFNLGARTGGERFAAAANIGYINDLAESDAIVDDGTAMSGRTPAWTASVIVNAGDLTLIGEYVTATESIAAYANDEPSAYNLEAALAFSAMGKPASMAIGYQGTEDAANTAGGQPESRVLGALGVQIMDGTSVAIEYAHEQAYDGSESDTLTGQLAVEF